ncbi:MAG: hypothetical protein ACT4TC_05090 [Myxococcaceae bacterium]
MKALVLLLLAGCGNTGQSELTYPVSARGEAPVSFAVGAWTVRLGKAQLAFGPAYFCATAAASSDLCRSAISEVARTEVIDALNPEPQPLGDAFGATGAIRSATYDLGISWFNTQREPRPSKLPSSVLLEGTATQGSRVVAFTAAVDVVPKFQGTRAVQGSRVDADLQPGIALQLEARPSAWLNGVDFTALSATSDAVTIAPGSPTADTLVFNLTVSSPLSFNWSQESL